jgi:hypothetical protein
MSDQDIRIQNSARVTYLRQRLNILEEKLLDGATLTSGQETLRRDYRAEMNMLVDGMITSIAGLENAGWNSH